MGVGYQVTVPQVNQQAGLLATQLRDWSRSAVNFHTAIDALGGDDTSRANALAAMGMAPADATQMVYLNNVLNTVAQIYYGNAGQTPPFNFDNALSALWGVT